MVSAEKISGSTFSLNSLVYTEDLVPIQLSCHYPFAPMRMFPNNSPDACRTLWGGGGVFTQELVSPVCCLCFSYCSRYYTVVCPRHCWYTVLLNGNATKRIGLALSLQGSSPIRSKQYIRRRFCRTTVCMGQCSGQPSSQHSRRIPASHLSTAPTTGIPTRRSRHLNGMKHGSNKVSMNSLTGPISKRTWDSDHRTMHLDCAKPSPGSLGSWTTQRKQPSDSAQ